MKIEEPYIHATIIIPDEFVGATMQMLQSKRGIQRDVKYTMGKRVVLEYDLPLAEMVLDFYDKLMTITKGFASFDYEHADYRESNLIKLEIMINKDVVDALSVIVHKDQAYYKARDLVDRIKEVIPRQMFEVTVQASIGKKILQVLQLKHIEKCYSQMLWW